MSFSIKDKGVLSSTYLDENNNTLTVYSENIPGRAIAWISKFLGRAVIITDGNKELHASKSNLSQFLQNKIKNELSYLSTETVKKELSTYKFEEKIENINNVELDLTKKLNNLFINQLFSSIRDESDKKLSAFSQKITELFRNETQANAIKNLESIFVKYVTDQTKNVTDDLSDLYTYLSKVQSLNNTPEDVKLFFNQIFRDLSKLYAESTPKDASESERDAPRSPTEIVVDLLAYLERPENQIYKIEYEKITQKTKEMFMTHNTTISKTKDLLQDIIEKFPKLPIADKAHQLLNSMMQKPILTRFHENIYGRVFDSSFVSKLIQNPPKEVLDSMSAMSKGLANHLNHLKLTSEEYAKISQDLRELLSTEDPRFWFPKVPDLNHVKDASDPIRALIEYLDKPKNTGHECISIPYLMVKVSLILKENNISPPWLQKADLAYSEYLNPQVTGIRVNRSGPKMNTEGSGITLHYQPTATKEEGLVPSQRPTTVRRPNLNPRNASVSAKNSLLNALRRGIPWASGMSGSTNISLFACKEFNQIERIDPKATLLGILMFLVYDGGHSMYEPLWAATQIEKKLGFDFMLGDSSKPEAFVPDYVKFNEMFTGETREMVSKAFSDSFDATVEYFNTHSHYAKNSAEPLKPTSKRQKYFRHKRRGSI